MSVCYLPSKADCSHRGSMTSRSHIAASLAVRRAETVEGLIPWLRVPDLELWMGSLSDIDWETIHSFTQHSGMPRWSPPPPGSGLRGYQTNQKSMFLSQGLPEAPACTGDSPAACSPPPLGWPT